MTIQLSTGARNGRLDAFETAVGTAAKLRILTGTQPADCATAQSGTQLAELALPSDWMAAAGTGTKVKAGSWTGTAGTSGTAGYFRIVDNAGTTAHMQGSVGQGSGDLSLDNTNIASAQTITINTFNLVDGNA